MTLRRGAGAACVCDAGLPTIPPLVSVYLDKPHGRRRLQAFLRVKTPNDTTFKRQIQPKFRRYRSMKVSRLISRRTSSLLPRVDGAPDSASVVVFPVEPRYPFAVALGARERHTFYVLDSWLCAI